MAQFRAAILILVLSAALQESAGAQTPKFFSDDPIPAMPAPLPIVGMPLETNINRVHDFFRQSGKPERRPPTPAGAINTLGEVPDSEWFTNRHGMHRMSRDELQQGPGPPEIPVPPFTIVSGKGDGVMFGFSIKDSLGQLYFAKLDPPDFPELATGAEVAVSKLLYAIGYNTPKNEIVRLKLSDLHVASGARITTPDRRSRPMAWWDVVSLFEQAHRYPDGTYRIVASRAIEGDNLGPFQYEGTRNDDPNDIVLHENRRDLRGLYVFSAWVNNTDARSGNTLDTVVEENGIRFIRHYLLDFASSFGSSGNRPKTARAGHEFSFPTMTEALTQIFSLGTVVEPWKRVFFPDLPGLGNFTSEEFKPDEWKTNFPNPAFLSRLPDDDYWAAKQVMAFTDDDIRAIVETGCYSDPRTSEYLIATLAKRRDAIGQYFFDKVLPLDYFRVQNAELLFEDLAVKYGFRTPRHYDIRWFRFDNISQKTDLIPADRSARLPVEAGKSAPGSYFLAVLHALGDPLKTVCVYFRKETDGYKVVGIERTW